MTDEKKKPGVEHVDGVGPITPIGDVRKHGLPDGGKGEVVVRPVQYNLQDYDRATANLQFIFEQDGEEPSTRTAMFSDGCHKSDEEPYARRLKVKQGSPQGIDLGWLLKPFASIGLIIIENNVGKGLKIKPTDEERAEHAKSILVVKDHPDAKGFKIRPGRFMFFEATDASDLTIESLNGTIKAHILVCPAGSVEE